MTEFNPNAISEAVAALIEAGHEHDKTWNPRAAERPPFNPFDEQHAPAELDQLEADIGHYFPADYRWFMNTFGSSTSLSRWGVPHAGSVETSPLACLLDPEWVRMTFHQFDASYDDCRRKDEIAGFNERHTDLVPIGGNAADPPYYWYCFDYRWDIKNPPIVWFNANVMFGEGDLHSLGWTASSFTELILRIRCVKESYSDLEETSPPLTRDAHNWYEARNRQFGLPPDTR